MEPPAARRLAELILRLVRQRDDRERKAKESQRQTGRPEEQAGDHAA